MQNNVIAISVPIAIGILPIFLHIIDKVMERFSVIREDVLQQLMTEDSRNVVKTVGASEANFKAVKTYFDFERKCHFVIALIIFNILSLYIAQTQCTGSFLTSTVTTLLGIIILAAALVLFILAVANRRVKAAAVNSTRRWEWISVIAFVIVLGIELWLHGSCGEPLAHHP